MSPRRLVALAPALLSVFALGACEREPALTMPAGFESARLGAAYGDVRATRPKARLAKQDGSVRLVEKNEPPRFRLAEISFHDASQGPVPPEESWKVQRVVLGTLDEEGLQVAAREVARAQPEVLEGLRATIGDRFEQMRKATQTSFGAPTDCEPGKLRCVWSFATYQVRLYGVEAATPRGEVVPIGVRYVVRSLNAPDLPPGPPLHADAPVFTKASGTVETASEAAARLVEEAAAQAPAAKLPAAAGPADGVPAAELPAAAAVAP